ncbi:tyrosine/phenylalanine carboxypeptidase domain-containing protein [Sphingomicrobium nitratireducens]|uniref:tyrosine/phenylalanine carboxypeptidase domain-containing protein n=1 Tax=Sphingomicrobium nitratireducens TaxID=2964666 RepID=UPI0022402774|nr:tyrosine/phenylalanine carboxypeptidase domain-containing protein [Sphingomicrobium nitratireducens]
MSHATADPLDLALEHGDLAQACDMADRALAGVADRFDYLLSVSPVNTQEAMHRWLDGGADGTPDFLYRDVGFDVSSLRKELHQIELTHLHEPLVEGLLLEKRRELDKQLELIEQRCTSEFRATSEELYGAVSEPLLEAARAILERVKYAPCRVQRVGAEELREHAAMLVETYREEDAEFAPVIEIRDDVTGLLVSYPKLMIDAGASVSVRRVDPLLSHELSIHMVTGFNGAHQPLSLFASGLAGYEEIQEGLGVFAEWAVGGLYASRLRLIAARVVSVHCMLEGADFTECHRELVHHCGVGQRTAFKICARVHRGGGFAKDAIYLRGFFRVMDYIADGGELSPYWVGKIAPVHVPIIKELEARGLAVPARLTPEFLSREDAKARIADYVDDPSPDKWLSPEPDHESAA